MAAPKEILSGIRLALSRRDSRAKWIKAIHEYSVAVDPGSIAADDSLRVQVTLTGVKVGDHVLTQPPAALVAGLQVGQAFVSAADTLELEIENTTTIAAIDPASQTWKFLVFKS